MDTSYIPVEWRFEFMLLYMEAVCLTHILCYLLNSEEESQTQTVDRCSLENPVHHSWES